MFFLAGVEIFSTGTHNPSNSPEQTWTAADLDDIISAFNDGIPDAVHIKIGHTSKEFIKLVAEQLGVPEAVVQGEPPDGDGQISLGRVVALRRRQNKLVADIETPEQVAQLIMKGYSTVYCELLKDYEDHKWVLSSVALLGAERPAVEDLADLAHAAVLVERKSELVYAFSVAPGGLIIEYQEPELDEIDAALEEAIKGKRGAQFIRSVWQEIRGRWEKLRRHKESTEEELDMELTGIAKSLNMQEGATAEEVGAAVDEIVSALASLKEMLGLGAEAPPEEVAEAAKAKLGEAQAVTLKEGNIAVELKKRDDRIAILERGTRIAYFKEKVTGLTAIAGTPDELAERLVKAEAYQGEEAAEERLAEWEKAQEYAEKAGVLVRLGSARNGSEGTDLGKATAKHQEEHPELTFAEAQTAVVKTQPALYAQYLEER